MVHKKQIKEVRGYHLRIENLEGRRQYYHVSDKTGKAKRISLKTAHEKYGVW